jgi:AraC-like DNA-binding protein
MSQREPFHFNITGADPTQITAAARAAGLSYRVEADSYLLEMPPHIADGTIYSYRLRQGLLLHIGDVTPHVPVRLNWELEQEPLVEVHLHLAGAYQSYWRESRTTYHVDAGSLYINALQAPSNIGHVAYAPGVRQLQIEVTLLADELECEAEPWRGLLPERSGRPPCNDIRAMQLSATLQAAAAQLLGCPFMGAPRRLYLESKALEILALTLDTAAGSPGPSSTLRPHDQERIRAARDILLARLDAPPSLEELARAVHISDFKLKQGFRQLFGTTVFGYLHLERMRRAYELLRAGEQRVLQVALSVGYACPSRFAVAFRRHFGLKPSEVG